MIVTGCYAQRAPEELASLPGVSWVVGNSHKPELPQIIENLSSASEPARFVPAATLQWSSDRLAIPAQILTGEFERKPLLSAPVFGGEANHTRPTLKIQDGCNSRCSYCVIPFVRGKSRSLPPEMVVAGNKSAHRVGHSRNRSQRHKYRHIRQRPRSARHLQGFASPHPR